MLVFNRALNPDVADVVPSLQRVDNWSVSELRLFLAIMCPYALKNYDSVLKRKNGAWFKTMFSVGEFQAFGRRYRLDQTACDQMKMCIIYSAQYSKFY